MSVHRQETMYYKQQLQDLREKIVQEQLMFEQMQQRRKRQLQMECQQRQEPQKHRKH